MHREVAGVEASRQPKCKLTRYIAREPATNMTVFGGRRRVRDANLAVAHIAQPRRFVTLAR
jgi:hypothetical protein